MNLVPSNPKDPFPSIGKLFVLRGNKSNGLPKRIYNACEQLYNIARAVSPKRQTLTSFHVRIGACFIGGEKGQDGLIILKILWKLLIMIKN